MNEESVELWKYRCDKLVKLYREMGERDAAFWMWFSAGAFVLGTVIGACFSVMFRELG